jgi:hypothetical protein
MRLFRPLSAGPGRRCWTMTDREGLSLREAVELCGGEITLREATRMRQLVNDPSSQSAVAAHRGVAASRDDPQPGARRRSDGSRSCTARPRVDQSGQD